METWRLRAEQGGGVRDKVMACSAERWHPETATARSTALMACSAERWHSDTASARSTA
jgi:hypothetical protein